MPDAKHKPAYMDIKAVNPRYEGATFEIVVKAMLQRPKKADSERQRRSRRTSPNRAAHSQVHKSIFMAPALVLHIRTAAQRRMGWKRASSSPVTDMS